MDKHHLWNGIDIARELQAGVPMAVIAKRAARPVNAAYQAAKRRGIDLTHGFGTDISEIRREALKLEPEEAVEFLLYVLEAQFPYLGTDIPPELEPVADAMTPQELTLAVALFEAAPRLVSNDTLYAAMCERHASGEMPQPSVLRVVICRIRAKLPASLGRIETMWGRGYRFIRPE